MDLINQHLLLFVLAATPWIELLVVIPAGIGMGLNPFPVAVITFLGNAIPVFVIVYGYKHWQIWRGSKIKKKPSKNSKRRQRAMAIWNKYGLPGLAFLGPLLTGIHLATIIALAFKPDKKDLVVWMNLSLFIWTIGMTIVSFYGIEGIKSLIN